MPVRFQWPYQFNFLQIQEGMAAQANPEMQELLRTLSSAQVTPEWISALEEFAAYVEGLVGIVGNAGALFEYTSATVCTLNRVGGGQLPLYFNGQLIYKEIPAAGISFSNSGLSANTLYYAYAYFDGVTIRGEFSTTGHADSNGVETKSDDQTRSLVGMVRTNAASQFLDSPSRRQVATWYNRRQRGLYLQLSGDQAITAVTPTYTSLSCLIQYLTWGADTGVSDLFWCTGRAVSNAAGSQAYMRVYLDGSALGSNALGFVPGVASTEESFPGMAFAETTEGFHQVDLYGSQGGAGTATFYAVYTALMGQVFI